MADSLRDCDVPALLAAAWPPSRWQESHVLIAVSGGADSMALLRAILDAKARVGGAGRLVAGHVNHQLRRESAADEEWLRRQCQRLGVPLETRRCDAAALAAEKGDGIEAAARKLRYGLLAEMAEGVGARFVALGHTYDDQVETVLFRILRGTGLHGLAGMRATRPLSPGVALVRPLLGCRRAQVQSYVESLGQPYLDDPTNAHMEFSRNRVRTELLPYLREHFNSDVDGALHRLASLGDEAGAVIGALAETLLDRCDVAVDGAGVTLQPAALARQPEIVVAVALRRAWSRAGLAEQGMTYRWWRELALLALDEQASASATLNLPGAIRAKRREGLLIIERPSPTC